MKKLSVTLLENGISFVEEGLIKAIEAETTEGVKSWTFAIVHLAIAFELLFKAKLEGERPGTVYPRGIGNRSISAHEALDKLLKIEPKLFSDGEKKEFKALLNLRNKIVHSSLTANIVDLREIFAGQFSLLKNLFEHCFGGHLQQELESELWEEVLEVRQRVYGLPTV
jgi:hypothetical protein